MIRPMTQAMTRLLPRALLLAALCTVAVAACQRGPDPAEQAAAAAAEAARIEGQAEEIAARFDAEFAKGNWELAAMHGQALKSDFPDSAAFERIAAQLDEASAKGDAAREQRRMQGLWSYSRVPAGKGTQVSASIYARDGVRIDGAARTVRLIFRDHPEWGRSSYLVLESGDFDCYGGCRLKVAVDDGAAKSMAGSRPKTDEAIAMFIEDERALWRQAKSAERTLSIEVPIKGAGRHAVVFEVGGLDAAQMPGWN